MIEKVLFYKYKDVYCGMYINPLTLRFKLNTDNIRVSFVPSKTNFMHLANTLKADSPSPRPGLLLLSVERNAVGPVLRLSPQRSWPPAARTPAAPARCSPTSGTPSGRRSAKERGR